MGESSLLGDVVASDKSMAQEAGSEFRARGLGILALTATNSTKLTAAIELSKGSLRSL